MGRADGNFANLTLQKMRNQYHTIAPLKNSIPNLNACRIKRAVVANDRLSCRGKNIVIALPTFNGDFGQASRINFG